MARILEQRDTTNHGQRARQAFDRRMRSVADGHRYLGFFAGVVVGFGLGALVIAAYVTTYP